MRRSRRGAWAALALLASGCAAPPPAAVERDGASPPRTAPHNLSGFSMAFRQGYAAGCRSSESRERRRDESRYTADADYAMGWNDGYSACLGRK